MLGDIGGIGGGVKQKIPGLCPDKKDRGVYVEKRNADAGNLGGDACDIHDGILSFCKVYFTL